MLGCAAPVVYLLGTGLCDPLRVLCVTRLCDLDMCCSYTGLSDLEPKSLGVHYLPVESLAFECAVT